MKGVNRLNDQFRNFKLIQIMVKSNYGLKHIVQILYWKMIEERAQTSSMKGRQCPFPSSIVGYIYPFR